MSNSCKTLSSLCCGGYSSNALHTGTGSTPPPTFENHSFNKNLPNKMALEILSMWSQKSSAFHKTFDSTRMHIFSCLAPLYPQFPHTTSTVGAVCWMLCFAPHQHLLLGYYITSSIPKIFKHKSNYTRWEHRVAQKTRFKYSTSYFKFLP